MAIAFIALLAAISGTAVALPGKNSVDSGDIKNKQVKGKDLANSAVTGKKVKNGSLTGADVKDDSLTGGDVNESTLGQVPSANTATHADSAGNADTVGGVGVNALTVGRSNASTECFGDATGYDCASVSLTLPRPGRVLLITSAPMHADADGSSARCAVRANGTELPGTETDPGNLQDTDDAQDSESANGGMTTVTDVVPAGATTFTLRCADTGGNPHFRHTSISAVLLGSS
jgi:hypothetical protein